MLPYPLSNFQIQRYFQNEPTFKDIYSPNNLPNITNDRVYIAKSDEYESTETR